MSIQLNTGSLISLGISTGDVAAIYGLSKRLGNWLSAESGDNEFLTLLGEDDFGILRRRGLIDLPTFNKRWRKEMRLFANQKPLVFKGRDADAALESLGRFTGVMVCVATALDTFTSPAITQSILKNVMKELLRTTERGEDLLATQYTSRLNAWRSVACLRGFLNEATQIRQNLLKESIIMDGLMPRGESKLMEDFLLWLLSDSTETFTTSSSDIAGTAMCLSRLGIDILAVEGLGSSPSHSYCRLIYSKNSLTHFDNPRGPQPSSGPTERELLTTVSLLHPEESVASFPVSKATHNRCRQAWKSGQRAAKYVAVGVVASSENQVERKAEDEDIRYSFIDRGTVCHRVDAEIQEMATFHAFLVNRELLHELETLFRRETEENLVWLNQQTSFGPDDLSKSSFQDSVKIDLYCVFQSFFMGYYYDIFIRMVDTSSLKVQAVEGWWGFRRIDFITFMREQFWEVSESQKKNATIPRKRFIEVLSRLFLNRPIELLTSYWRQWYIGVVGKRTLLTNSLVNGCYHPGEIGRFVLLDVDVGGIPRDSNGLICSGFQDVDGTPEEVDCEKHGTITSSLKESSPPEDVTCHAEADWDGDPERLLLCARYKGRRLVTISPALADKAFCDTYIKPVENPTFKPLTAGVPCTISDFVGPDGSQKILAASSTDVPVIIQAHGRPRLRHVAAGLYENHFLLLFASNCIHAAIQTGRERLRQREQRGERRLGESLSSGWGKASFAIVGSHGVEWSTVFPKESVKGLDLYSVMEQA